MVRVFRILIILIVPFSLYSQSSVLDLSYDAPWGALTASASASGSGENWTIEVNISVPSGHTWGASAGGATTGLVDSSSGTGILGNVAPGTYAFTVFSGGSTVLVIGDLVIPFGTKEIQLNVSNPTDYPVTYDVYQGEDYLTSLQVDANSGISSPLTVTNNDEEITMLTSVGGLSRVGNSVFNDSNGLLELEAISLGTGGDVEANEPIEVPQPSDMPISIPSNDPIWIPEPVDDEGNTVGDSLTDSVYRQGIDKIVSSLDSANNLLESLVTSEDLVSNFEVQGTLNELEISEEEIIDSDAISDNRPKVENLVDGITNAPTLIIPSVTPYRIYIPFKVPGHTQTALDISFSDYASEISVFRNLCKAIMSILFYQAVMRAVKEGFA